MTSTGKEATTLDIDPADYDAGEHASYMRKEILEQPDAAERVLRGRLDERFGTAHLGGLNMDARDTRAIRRVKVLGCGSAYYVGQMGAALVEELARIPADAEAASEFRYRNPIIEPDTLYVAVSQSGETIDTLLAVQEIRRKGGRVIGLVNVVGSAIARECDGGIYLHAGPEVAVASTKALTNMFVGFALLALQLGRVRDLSIADGKRLISGLLALPGQIAEILEREDELAEVAVRLAEAESLFFVGRVRGFPVAREGAQKFKEISYRHAEAYQTSELKHGPLALISPDVPTVAVVPEDELTDRNVGALHEIAARRGPLVVVTHKGVDLGDVDGDPDRRTPQRAGARPDPAHPAAAAVGLPRGPAPRSRHRQAPQPGQVGHGRVNELAGNECGCCEPTNGAVTDVSATSNHLSTPGSPTVEGMSDESAAPEITFDDLGLDEAVLKALRDVGLRDARRRSRQRPSRPCSRAATWSVSRRPAPARRRRSRCRSCPGST